MPKLSALLGSYILPPAPIKCDNSAGLPADFGMMLNDQLGDCTCAAYYHARQIWSGRARGEESTLPDSDVLALYEQACGYNPADPNTDQGGVEQDVLTYLLKYGAPGCEPIIAFVEIDSLNLDNMKRAIYESGCVYIGVNLPQNIIENGEPPALWKVVADAEIAGGHAIILCGYDLDGFDLISWGRKYRCTHGFIAEYCEEAYIIADREWIGATGKTPLGMSVAKLESIMAVLKHDQ